MLIAFLHQSASKFDFCAYLRFLGLMSHHVGSKVLDLSLDLPQPTVRRALAEADMIYWDNENPGSGKDYLEALELPHLVTLLRTPDPHCALLAKTDALHFRRNAHVFIPSAEGIEKQKEIYLALKSPTLLIALSPTQLKIATPGVTTLCVAHRPPLMLQAISSATGVITGSLDPALTAIGQQIPAVVLSDDSTLRAQALALGIPIVSPNEPQAADRIETLFANYPWSHLKLNLPVPQKRERVVDRSVPPLHICTVSDQEYLPAFLGFLQNVLDCHPGEVRIHLLALDSEIVAELSEVAPNAPIDFYSEKDLWTPSERQRIERRPKNFRAFSSNGRFLLKVLSRVQQPVLYSDNDIYFYESPITLLTHAMKDHSVLLFPHWNDRFPEARYDGIYNAGLIGVAPGSERFLRWWAALCLQECSASRKRGTVGDQAYLDFAPAYFEGVKIYHQCDHNIARWNLKSTGARWACDRNSLVVENGETVKSFHAAFIDSEKFYETKFVLDQLATFFLGIKKANDRSVFYANTVQQQLQHWPTLSRAVHCYEGLWLLRGDQRRYHPKVLRSLTQPWATPLRLAVSSFRKAANFLVGAWPFRLQDKRSLAANWVQYQKMALFDAPAPTFESEASRTLEGSTALEYQPQV